MVSVFQFKDPTQQANRYDTVKYELPEQPRQVRVETARACSARCTWCHLWGRPADQGLPKQDTFMATALYEAVLDDIATWPKPLVEIVPVNFGEVFMRKDWQELMALTSKRLPKTGICVVTTGILLNEENLEKLAQVSTLAYVNFSLNAFFAETWARQHQRPEKLMQRCVEAVHRFRDRRPDVRTNVSMVYDQRAVTEIEKDLFLNYWAPFGQVSVSPASFAGWPDIKPKVPVTLPCRSVFDGLTVFEDGQVSTNCCFNGLKEPSLGIGMVPGQRLLDIWAGERLRKITELHNGGRRAELPLCKGCTFA